MAYATFPTFTGGTVSAGRSFPVTRTYRWSSLRQKAISGRETFQPLWVYPLRDYEVSFAVLNASGSPRFSNTISASSWPRKGRRPTGQSARCRRNCSITRPWTSSTSPDCAVFCATPHAQE